MTSEDDTDSKSRCKMQECGDRNPLNKGGPYVDDLTQFMAWQNLYLIQYNNFLVRNNVLNTMHFSMLSGLSRPADPHLNGVPHLPQQSRDTRSTPFNVTQPQAGANGQPDRRAIEASLAPLHKRIAAELVDSIILLVVKLVFVTVIFGDKYVEKFQLILGVDEKTTIQDLETMLIQALVFRAVVIAYETICLSGTVIPNTRGMTLGKKLLNLRVVKCEIVESIDRINNRVRVIPGGVLGFWSSFLRAFLKSFIVSVLFPMLIPLNFVAFHNRLIYDLISNSIVIQDDQN